ncbi:hypothetical protein V6C03_14830 [Methyloligella sp. 2.7D]|uniref:hypothetical protein n=1 Tax=unclassified Methyloligella TaxID=2625955 RepID=UPI00157C0B61|nr:hypothetical protein [Methyloligella sp. GL2]QKP76981.1 hypothetical protein HT051_05635 [Methyloligella sp. GL2]
MLRSLLAAIVMVFAIAGVCSAAPADGQRAGKPDPNAPSPDDPRYLSMIVKACHAAEIPLEPTNQGKIYDDEVPLTHEERQAMYEELGCIDVPLPMQWITGTMTAAACRGHAGYIAAMQFLEQRPDLAEYPAVGAWECKMQSHPVISPVGQ